MRYSSINMENINIHRFSTTKCMGTSWFQPILLCHVCEMLGMRICFTILMLWVLQGILNRGDSLFVKGNDFRLFIFLGNFRFQIFCFEKISFHFLDIAKLVNSYIYIYVCIIRYGVLDSLNLMEIIIINWLKFHFFFLFLFNFSVESKHTDTHMLLHLFGREYIYLRVYAFHKWILNLVIWY